MRRLDAEATRRGPTAHAPLPEGHARPACDADAFVARGGQQFAAGQLAEALASYEAAYACRREPAQLQKVFVVACNLRDLAKVKSYWKRLSPQLRSSALAVCVRNGIDEATLSTP
jgi:hypothetical protein